MRALVEEGNIPNDINLVGFKKGRLVKNGENSFRVVGVNVTSEHEIPLQEPKDNHLILIKGCNP